MYSNKWNRQILCHVFGWLSREFYNWPSHSVLWCIVLLHVLGQRCDCMCCHSWLKTSRLSLLMDCEHCNLQYRFSRSSSTIANLTICCQHWLVTIAVCTVTFCPHLSRVCLECTKPYVPLYPRLLSFQSSCNSVFCPSLILGSTFRLNKIEFVIDSWVFRPCQEGERRVEDEQHQRRPPPVNHRAPHRLGNHIVKGSRHCHRSCVEGNAEEHVRDQDLQRRFRPVWLHQQDLPQAAFHRRVPAAHLPLPVHSASGGPVHHPEAGGSDVRAG